VVAWQMVIFVSLALRLKTVPPSSMLFSALFSFVN